MILSRLFSGAGGFLLAGLIVSAAAAGPQMTVEVELSELSDNVLHVFMLIEGNDQETLHLRGVPTYVDNPVAEARGEVVRSLRVHSGDRELVPRRGRTDRGESTWTVSPVGASIEIEYTLQIEFVAGPMVEAYPIHMPSMDEDRAWLSGNHVFLTPEFSENRVQDLRRHVPVDLRFRLPDDLDLYGPPAEVTLNNLHELLSLQFGLGDFETISGKGKDWDWAVVFEEAHDFSRAERKLLATRMEQMTRRTAELFGGVPFGSVSLLVFRAERMGGLEGSWACHAYLPRDLDLSHDRDPDVGEFFSVVFHELVHTWLPIAVFAIDDPWFKEGVTSYYGSVLAARAGWIGPAEVDRLFSGYKKMVFGKVELEPVALSDPRIWYEEYSGENWRRLTYDRGHAVALLLDVYLRSETGNQHGLDDVLRVLYRDQLYQGFSRGEFLVAIADATGIDAAGFFAQYVDNTDIPEPAEVDRALRKAIKYGVYKVD